MKIVAQIVSISINKQNQEAWEMFKSRNRNVSDALMALVKLDNESHETQA